VTGASSGLALQPSANPLPKSLRPVTIALRLRADHLCTVMEREEEAKKYPNKIQLL